MRRLPSLLLYACSAQACRTRTPVRAASQARPQPPPAHLRALLTLPRYVAAPTESSVASFPRLTPRLRGIPPGLSRTFAVVAPCRTWGAWFPPRNARPGAGAAWRGGRSARFDVSHGVPRAPSRACLFHRCDGSLRRTDRVRATPQPVPANTSSLSLRTPSHTPPRERGSSFPTAPLFSTATLKCTHSPYGAIFPSNGYPLSLIVAVFLSSFSSRVP